MTVETYSDKYFLDVVRLVENFHKEALSEYDDLFNPNVLIENINSINPKDIFLLIVNETCQGILYGTRFKSMVSGKEVWQEIIWYVNESFRGYGVKLLSEVEKVLKSSGVSTIIMAVLENSKTEKLKTFYQRLGYKPMETHFVRSI